MQQGNQHSILILWTLFTQAGPYANFSTLPDIYSRTILMTAIVARYNICRVLYTVCVYSLLLEVPRVTQTLLSNIVQLGSVMFMT